VFAAWHTLNGNGEMTGTTWVEESGCLGTPILITNTHSVGVVRDAVIAWNIRQGSSRDYSGDEAVQETDPLARHGRMGCHCRRRRHPPAPAQESKSPSPPTIAIKFSAPGGESGIGNGTTETQRHRDENDYSKN
jgi:hypothetical protein